MADPDPTLARELLRFDLDLVHLAYAVRDESAWSRCGVAVIGRVRRLVSRSDATHDMVLPGIALAIAMDRRDDVAALARWFGENPGVETDVYAVIAVLLLSFWTGRDQVACEVLAFVAAAERNAGGPDPDDVGRLLFDVVRAGLAGDAAALASAAAMYQSGMARVVAAKLRESEAGPCSMLETAYLCDLTAIAFLTMFRARGLAIPTGPFFDASFALSASFGAVAPPTRH